MTPSPEKAGENVVRLVVRIAVSCPLFLLPSYSSAATELAATSSAGIFVALCLLVIKEQSLHRGLLTCFFFFLNQSTCID